MTAECFGQENFAGNPSHLRMICTRSLIEIARKWQKKATSGRKKISLGSVYKSSSKRKASKVEDKGRFVAYVTNGKRYMIPFTYLKNKFFKIR
ncbi:hypothetical protein EJ110_NYTH18547 [Nymphaea thermarum]|nr:hypothetical protein EJ110_NYTH18547 [Nymphaea thermarum]